jgi:hypothetical protein
MDGPFGVEISKRKKDVPDVLTPMLPASTVRAYENTGAKSTEAASRNLGAKAAGTAAGVGAAGVGLSLLARKPKAGGLIARSPKLKPLSSLMDGADRVMNSGHLFGMKGKGIKITPDHKKALAVSGLGGTGGGIAGNQSLQNIKDNPRYKYGR